MDDVAKLLADRIRAARTERGWTLERLAEISGVSRAALSKMERAEVSPTAAILGRVAAGLEISMASLFGDDAGEGARDDALTAPLARAAASRSWTDPETGYTRRNVSPPMGREAAEIVDVTLPPGARVVFDNAPATRSLLQQVWLISGTLDLRHGHETTRLAPGDCFAMRLDRPNVFHNPGEEPARYAVVIARVAARPEPLA